MSKMSNIYLTIKRMFKDLIMILVTLILFDILLMINFVGTIKLEQRLTEQEQYMHKVQADIDNLYKVVD